MKRIGRFLLRHIVIGFFAMLPVLLLYLLLGQLFDMAIALTTPITDVLPDSAFSDAVQQHFIAAVLLVMILGLVGLAARTELGTTICERLERRYLKRLPLYEMLRNLAGSLSGNEAVTGYRPALVTIGAGVRTLAFIIEEHTNGDYTIFVPLAPTPGVGQIQIVSATTIHLLDAPAMQALNCIMNWGDGTAALLTPRHSPQGSLGQAAE
jgi:uncharacterized membrane protein